jgi:hypothetical protein
MHSRDAPIPRNFHVLILSVSNMSGSTHIIRVAAIPGKCPGVHTGIEVWSSDSQCLPSAAKWAGYRSVCRLRSEGLKALYVSWWAEVAGPHTCLDLIVDNHSQCLVRTVPG